MGLHLNICKAMILNPHHALIRKIHGETRDHFAHFMSHCPAKGDSNDEIHHWLPCASIAFGLWRKRVLENQNWRKTHSRPGNNDTSLLHTSETRSFQAQKMVDVVSAKSSEFTGQISKPISVSIPWLTTPAMWFYPHSVNLLELPTSMLCSPLDSHNSILSNLSL